MIVISVSFKLSVVINYLNVHLKYRRESTYFMSIHNDKALDLKTNQISLPSYQIRDEP